MFIRVAIVCLGMCISAFLSAQSASTQLRTISIEKDGNFDGFDLLEINEEQLFVLAEHWHNIRSVPRATMKVLRYLHANGNVRILAIEQGASAAHMINEYLESGDTAMLRHIARNTMFWGRENYAFFQDLRAFNMTIPDEERISVQSIDIEYKMESAIFVINELLEGKEIPTSLAHTVGQFHRIFESTKAHREQFDGLAVMFYYDKEFVTQLVQFTLYELENRPEAYMDFFDADYDQFATMIEDMHHGLIFDYTNPNTRYKFRDKLIYGKFVQLLENQPDKGILCVIGERHATKGSSIHKLKIAPNSPIQGKVMKIRISALFNKSFLSAELRRLHFNYPNQLKRNPTTLIKHSTTEKTLKSKQLFDYTLFINEDGNLTRFKNVYQGGY